MAATSTDINVKICLEDSYTDVTAYFTRSSGNEPVKKIREILKRIQLGSMSGKVFYHVEHTTTEAAQTITFDSSAGSDGDTLTINGIVFTAKDTPSNRAEHGEYLLYADSDTAQAVAFKNAWNAHPVARLFGTAANASEVVTITTREGGTLFNQGTLVTSNASFAAVGAATFASGAAGTTVVQLNADPKAASAL